MPVQRSRVCVAMIVKVMTLESAFNDHSARYVQALPTQPGGVDHERVVGVEATPTTRINNYRVLFIMIRSTDGRCQKFVPGTLELAEIRGQSPRVGRVLWRSIEQEGLGAL